VGEALTKEQIEDLEGKISQLPTIKKHDDDITEIIGDLEGLKEGQTNMKADIRALDTKVDDMAKSLKDDIKELGYNIAKKIDDKEMGELRYEIRTLKKKEEKEEAKEEARKWDLTRGAVIVFFGMVAAVFLYLMGVK